ncbi:MAG: DUF6962 family protein [Gemmatimonadales bacterium]
MNDPDVVLTDLGLAILGAWLGWRLGTAPGRGSLAKAGAVLLGGLASAALWGAIFHAFFLDTATLPGFIAWIPVALSILVVAATLLDLSLRLLAPRLTPPIRRSIVAVYAAAFAAVVLLVDESFPSIVRFYLPALLLFLVAAVQQAIRSGSAGWRLIAVGFTVSIGAAVLQQARVSLHPVYFDHNAVYHVVQGVAVVLLYLGFRRLPQAPAGAYDSGTDQAPRPG